MSKWTPEEIDFCQKNYADNLTADIAKALGRTCSSVYQQARKMGLVKSEAHLERNAGRFSKNNPGEGSRFLKGQTPWNKGKKFNAGGRSAKTRFKKGNKPQTWVPVGTEKENKDGILMRKVSDTRVKRIDWRPVHVLVWEAENGEVPSGHIVVFKNGNKRDFSINNLECVSRAENMRRNSYQNRYPPEVAKLIQLRGALNRQINQRLEQ